MAVDPDLPRFLTEDEIDNILDKAFNKPFEDDPNKAVAPVSASRYDRQVMYDNNIQLIRMQLSDIKITPKAIPDIIERLVYRYTKSRVEPGTPIGVLAGESLGGPVTQMALNSFHQSGSSKTVGSGIDNLRALITLTERKISTATIHYINKNMSVEEVLLTRKDIVSLTMLELVEDWDIDTQVYPKDQWWYDAYMDLYPNKLEGVIEENRITWFLRIELDINKMYIYDISMNDIVRTLEYGGGGYMRVITSPFSEGVIYIYVVPSSLEAFTKQQQAINQDNIVMLFFQMSIIPSFNELSFRGIKKVNRLFPTEAKTWSIVMNEEREYTPDIIHQQPIDLQDELKRTWLLSLNFALMETSGITVEKLINLCKVTGMTVSSVGNLRMIVILPKEAGEMSPHKWVEKLVTIEEDKQKQFKKEHEKDLYVSYRSDLLNAANYIYAETNGSNLLQILMHDGIDTYYTYSNEINVVYELFGIEAARNLFIIEFKRALDDQYIDPRHIILIADVMFNQGKPNSITLRGISRQRTSFLSLMTIEKALDVIQNVAFMGRTESIESTSASIMVNKQVLIGTGFIDVAPDESFNDLIQEMREKQQKINSDDLANAFSDLEATAFGIQETVSLPDESSSVYDMIFGEAAVDEPVGPTAPIPDSIISSEPPEGVTVEPTIKMAPVYDPALDIIHQNFSFPTLAQPSEVAQTFMEEHTGKSPRVVLPVEEAKIAYYAVDNTGVSTALQPVQDVGPENIITPPSKKKGGLKKLAELKAIAETKPKKNQ